VATAETIADEDVSQEPPDTDTPPAGKPRKGKARPRQDKPSKPAAEPRPARVKPRGRPRGQDRPAEPATQEARPQGRKPRRAASALDDIFARLRLPCIMVKQISDPTRAAIVFMLKGESMNVTEMCKFLTLSQPAVSHHLALLRHGRIIESRRQGKNNYYSLTDDGMVLAGLLETLIP
jgi:ArsR family transcriptional regulator, zinc-responsive transcriptional repressor